MNDPQFNIAGIPLYTKLAPCAQHQFEAIIRDRSSGCSQSSSFTCFCVDSSSQFSSLISTAVAKGCSETTTATTTTTSANKPEKEVGRALAVWASYCAKTTDLGHRNTDQTPTAASPTHTQTPHPSHPPTSTKPSTIAFIVVPVILAFILLATSVIYCMRKQPHGSSIAAPPLPPAAGEEDQRQLATSTARKKKENENNHVAVEMESQSRRGVVEVQ